MFCPHCGETNPSDAKFCGACGRGMPDAFAGAQPAGAVASVVAAKAAPAAVSGGLKWGIIASSVLLPFVGIVMGLVYIVSADSAKKAVGKTWLYTGIGMSILWIMFSSSS